MKMELCTYKNCEAVRIEGTHKEVKNILMGYLRKGYKIAPESGNISPNGKTGSVTAYKPQEGERNC